MLRACPTCGMIVRLREERRTVCPRCRRRLPDHRRGTFWNTLAAVVATSAMLVFPAAVTLPFLKVEQLGIVAQRSLTGGIVDLYVHGQPLIATLIVVFSLVLPPVKLMLILYLASGARGTGDRQRAWLHTAVEQTGRWGMLDVLLVAVLIALVKLGDLVTFHPGPGLYVFAGFVGTSLVAGLLFDSHTLWRPAVSDRTDDPSPPAPASSAPGVPDPAVPESRIAVPRSRSSVVDSRSRLVVLAWAVPPLVAVFVGAALWHHATDVGPTIRIHFEQAHGLDVGDGLIHRGTTVGRVRSVDLDTDLGGVVVHVVLDPEAAGLAVRGSRFWIVRPRMDLTEVRGLDTVVGDKYLEVLVGPPGSPAERVFTGLEEPPVEDLFEPGGREIVLLSPQPQGLSIGSPIYYRTIRVGGVTSIGLTGDSSAGEIRGYIRPAYAHLIRERTRFWSLGAIRARGSITGGISLEVGTLETLLTGGIVLAVPPDAGEPAPLGRRFSLADRPEDEWLTWQPTLGERSQRQPIPLVRATLTWKTTTLLFTSEHTRAGWATPYRRDRIAADGDGDDDGADGAGTGRWSIVPTDLLTVPEEANEGPTLSLGPASGSLPTVRKEAVVFERVGPELSLVRLPRPDGDADPAATDADADPPEALPTDVASRPGDDPGPGEALAAGRLRRPRSIESVWLHTGEGEPLLLGDASLQVETDSVWSVTKTYPRYRDLTDRHGVPAVSATDGQVIGWLLATEDAVRIVLVGD